MIFALIIFMPDNYTMVMSNSTYRNLEKKKVNQIFLMDGAYKDIMFNLILVFLYFKVTRHLKKIKHYHKVMHFNSYNDTNMYGQQMSLSHVAQNAVIRRARFVEQLSSDDSDDDAQSNHSADFRHVHFGRRRLVDSDCNR